jgi:alanine-glyoxylate transaminase/serine-glyoxylate transaminase/serine-pyruvate transaminase
MAQGLGARPDILDFGPSAPFDPARVEEALRADRAHEIRAVLAVQTDTSTSVRSDIRALREALDAANHPALLMADCVASLGCDPFEMDAWGADVTIAASQKGLMSPPGLAFVWYNDRAETARARADCVTPYWDWRPRTNPDVTWKYYGGTPPVQALYGLRESLDMIEEEGIEQVWARHGALARAVWAACDAWGQGGPLRLNVADPAHRSHAVTALSMDEGQADALRRWLKDRTGVTLGIGLGREPASAHFRIGHMGHVNAHMVLGVLASWRPASRPWTSPMAAAPSRPRPRSSHGSRRPRRRHSAAGGSTPSRSSIARISAISASCASMIACAMARVSSSSPCSSTTRAMSMALWWCGIIMRRKSASGSPEETMGMSIIIACIGAISACIAGSSDMGMACSCSMPAIPSMAPWSIPSMAPSVPSLCANAIVPERIIAGISVAASFIGLVSLSGSPLI